MTSIIRRNISTIFKDMNSKYTDINTLIKKSDFSKYNIKFVDRIELTIYNPSTVSPHFMLRKNLYESVIYFNKNDDIRLTKTFKDDNFDKLIMRIKNFINIEIKL